MDPAWQALRILTTLAAAALVGLAAFPPLRPHRRRVLGWTLVVYLLGGAVVLVWVMTRQEAALF